MPEFTDTEVNLLTEYERLFWLSGQAPSLEALSQVLDVEPATLKGSLGGERVRLALRARGLPLPEPQQDRAAALSSEQLVLANMILSAFDKRSVREKLKEFNKNRAKEDQISPQKLQAWQRTPAWIGYVTSRAEAEFHGSIHLAYQNVRENVEDGDLSAAKLMLEMTGKYNPRLQVDLDVNFLVTQVLEAVQKHVKDPAILLAISEELEGAGVLPGSVPSQPGIPQLAGGTVLQSSQTQVEEFVDVELGSF